MFEAEGVEYMFGNPGTSEAPMMAVMDQYPSIEYVLVLQEGVAVGLAEGYARSTGKVPPNRCRQLSGGRSRKPGPYLPGRFL